MKKRSLVLVVAGIMLFTFITAPPAHAIVPALAWVVWGMGVAVSSVAVLVDLDNQKAQHERGEREASDRGEQEKEVKPGRSDVQARTSGG